MGAQRRLVDVLTRKQESEMVCMNRPKNRHTKARHNMGHKQVPKVESEGQSRWLKNGRRDYGKTLITGGRRRYLSSVYREEGYEVSTYLER